MEQLNKDEIHVIRVIVMSATIQGKYAPLVAGILAKLEALLAGQQQNGN